MIQRFRIKGAWQFAAWLFWLSLVAFSQDLRTWLVDGSRALQTGENTQAEAAFRKALALKPDSVEILNDLAISLARQNRQAEAIELYQRALKIEPRDAKTNRNLAIAYFLAERYADAWPLLEPLSAQSGDFQTLDLAGFTLFALDRYPESAAYLERASKLNLSDVPTLDMLGKAYIMRIGDYHGVTDVFARIMKVDPNSPAAHVMMGEAYDKMSRDDEARREFEAARSSNPKYPGVHSGLGQVYWKEGKVEQAAAEFQAELKSYPDDPVSHCLLGEILLKQNDPAAAALNFRAALQANPQYKEAQFGLGKAELGLDRPREAAAALARAIALDPDYVQAHYALGTALRKLGRADEAKIELATAEQIQARQRAGYTKKLNSAEHP